MKIRIIITTILFIQLGIVKSQTQEISFTAKNNSTYIQLDSVRILNLSQDTMFNLIWPDTSCSLDLSQNDKFLFVGYANKYTVGYIETEIINKEFRLFEGFPNPMRNDATLPLYIPENGDVHITVSDITGRTLFNSNWNLNKGYHKFHLIAGNDKLLIITANWQNISQSIKLIANNANNGFNTSISYISSYSSEVQYKRKSSLENLYVETGIIDRPDTSQTYMFQFATNIPCIDEPTVDYDGKTYNTIQIFNQCWLKENLNVGIMINGIDEQSDNEIIEKYCLDDSEVNCDLYGGLYQWNELMNYANNEGATGICPPGWHVPTDLELQILEGATDSQYGIEDSIWVSNWLYRGHDQSLHLKSNSGWLENGNGLNTYEFGFLASGHRFRDGHFSSTGTYGTIWSSTKSSSTYANRRRFASFSDGINRQTDHRGWGFSVRCLKDN